MVHLIEHQPAMHELLYVETELYWKIKRRGSWRKPAQQSCLPPLACRAKTQWKNQEGAGHLTTLRQTRVSYPPTMNRQWLREGEGFTQPPTALAD